MAAAKTKWWTPSNRRSSTLCWKAFPWRMRKVSSPTSAAAKTSVSMRSVRLSVIRELTGGDVDVVMGLSQDDRMRERAQVILIVTGLGAKSLADVLPGAEILQNKSIATTAPAD